MSVVSYGEHLSTSKSTPRKALTRGKRSTGGRNAFGRTTNLYQGGGVKRKYRDIDFTFEKKDMESRVESVEYDPYRTAFVALVCYKDGTRRYIVAPKGMKVGDTFIVSEDARVKMANRLPLRKIPIGTFVYNVELKPGAGGRIARSAGNYAEVVAQDAGYTLIKMPSSEIRKVLDTAWASVGGASNDEHHLTNLGKAGRSRWMGKRPKNRGSARNAVDHPHGGGEGRMGRGHRRSRTIHGRPTGKGQKTRRPKKYSNIHIVSRRKPGPRMRSSRG